MNVVLGIFLNRLIVALAGAGGGIAIAEWPKLHSAFCTATQLPGLY